MKKIFRNSLNLLLGAALLVSVLPGIFAADDTAEAGIDTVRASVVEAATAPATRAQTAQIFMNHLSK